jgi:hypothetical protein
VLILAYKDKAERLAKLTIREREESLSTSLGSRIMLNSVMILLSGNVKES